MLCSRVRRREREAGKEEQGGNLSLKRGVVIQVWGAPGAGSVRAKSESVRIWCRWIFLAEYGQKSDTARLHIQESWSEALR